MFVRPLTHVLPKGKHFFDTPLFTERGVHYHMQVLGHLNKLTLQQRTSLNMSIEHSKVAANYIWEVAIYLGENR